MEKSLEGIIKGWEPATMGESENGSLHSSGMYLGQYDHSLRRGFLDILNVRNTG